jgi:hypothetical protein
MRKRSTADEIEEQNRAALARIKEYTATVGEHVIKPLHQKIVDELTKPTDK